MRKATNRRIDKGYFGRTAAKTKAVNIRPYALRGGTRL